MSASEVPADTRFTSTLSERRSALLPRRVVTWLTFAEDGDRTVVQQARIAWSCALLLALPGMLLFPFGRLQFAPSNWVYVLKLALGLGIVIVAAAVILNRVARDEEPPARLLRASAMRLDLGARTLIVLLISGLGGAVAGYLAITQGVTFRDDRLAAIDLLFGFDWPEILQLVNSNPLLAEILVFAYTTTSVLLGIGLFYGVMTMDRRRLTCRLLPILASRSDRHGARPRGRSICALPARTGPV